MTPDRLYALTRRALGRDPRLEELEDWGDTLTCPPGPPCSNDCVHDDEADEALRQHRRGSSYPPTPADVRRLRIGLAKARVERAEQAARDAEQAHAVPMPDYVRQAMAAFDTARRNRDTELQVDDDTAARLARLEQARAAADAELALGSPS